VCARAEATCVCCGASIILIFTATPLHGVFESPQDLPLTYRFEYSLLTASRTAVPLSHGRSSVTLLGAPSLKPRLEGVVLPFLPRTATSVVFSARATDLLGAVGSSRESADEARVALASPSVQAGTLQAVVNSTMAAGQSAWDLGTVVKDADAILRAVLVRRSPSCCRPCLLTTFTLCWRLSLTKLTGLHVDDFLVSCLWFISQATGFSVTEAVAAVASPTSDLVDGCGTVSSPCSGHGMCSHVPAACSTVLRSCTLACACDVGYSGPTCAIVNETVGLCTCYSLF
jgi:hypothetical protein